MVKEMVREQAYLDTGYYAKGRIKRMRSRRESRYVRLDIRFDEKAYSFKSGYCFNVTRWNGHYAPEK